MTYDEAVEYKKAYCKGHKGSCYNCPLHSACDDTYEIIRRRCNFVEKIKEFRLKRGEINSEDA